VVCWLPYKLGGGIYSKSLKEGCLTGFWNSRKNRNNYSPIISRWGNGQVAELDRRYPIFGGEVK